MHHLNRLLIYGVLDRELPMGLITSLAMDHMLKGCPQCREENELAKSSLQQRYPTPSSLSVLAQPHVLSSYVQERVRNDYSRRKAALRDYKALMRLPDDEARMSRVRQARTRFRGPQLVQMLLDESQRRITRSPSKALHLAKLGEVMVTREGTESMDLRLYVSTLAQGGNAARAAGLFPDADDAFRMVRKILVHHDIEDLALLARIDDLESALRRDQGRLPDAERLLGRALVLYGMLEPSPVSDKARVMVGLAHLYKLRGMLIEAVEVTEGALRMLEESGAWSRDPRSCFAAMHDLVSYCLDLGSTRRASQILESHRQLIDDITEPFDRARVTALRRRIASYSK